MIVVTNYRNESMKEEKEKKGLVPPVRQFPISIRIFWFLYRRILLHGYLVQNVHRRDKLDVLLQYIYRGIRQTTQCQRGYA